MGVRRGSILIDRLAGDDNWFEKLCFIPGQRT